MFSSTRKNDSELTVSVTHYYSDAMSDSTEVPRPGLRERKKQLTRQAILDASERLFEEHGYDGVTVAQIADAANVSVKTLFTYFDSKEDLVFADEDATRDALLGALRDRAPGESALEAFRRYLHQWADEETGEGIEAFHQAYGDFPQLRSRMLLMFEHFEVSVAGLLAEETGAGPADPLPRLAAAQLISLLRSLTSTEARRYVNDRPAEERSKAVAEWIDASSGLLKAGLAKYAVRAAAEPRRQAKSEPARRP
jgi:AcrR family transcriptional regulator